MKGDFLSRLQGVASDEEREWMVLSLSLGSLSTNLQDAVYAAAVPHWFEVEFLAALIEEPSSKVSGLVASLAQLSFVELIPGEGYCIHERTRNLLLKKMWDNNRKHFWILSKRAASYCSKDGDNRPNRRIEFIYHLLGFDLDLGISELRNTAAKWFDSRSVPDSTIEAMLFVAREQADAERVSRNSVLGWILLWEALLDSRQSRFDLAEKKLLSIPTGAWREDELASEVRAALRYIEWMRGNPEKLFLEHLGPIRKLASHAARRSRLSKEEAEDFNSFVNTKFIENDYAMLRRFDGRSSSFGTYLVVVISRLLRDYLGSRRRRWRPSSQAVNGGVLAKKLEALIYRDGYSLAEAAEILGAKPGVEFEELARIASSLPPRTPNREVGEESLLSLAEERMRPDEILIARELVKARERVERALGVALAELSQEDRLLVKMRFGLDLKLADIARLTKGDQKAIYRKSEKVMNRLRKSLERQGIYRHNVKEILKFEEENSAIRSMPNLAVNI